MSAAAEEFLALLPSLPGQYEWVENGKHVGIVTLHKNRGLTNWRNEKKPRYHWLISDEGELVLLWLNGHARFHKIVSPGVYEGRRDSGSRLRMSRVIPVKPEEIRKIRSPLKGIRITRSELAKIMKRTTRTLKNWDDRGWTPTQVKWYGGTKVSGNTILYDVEKNFPAIQSMIPLESPLRTDQRLSQAILESKFG